MVACHGCDIAPEPKIEISMPSEGFRPPDQSKSILVFVVHPKKRALGFSVHIGDKPRDSNEIVADTATLMNSKIRSKIDEILATNADIESIIIKCTDSTKTSSVEQVRGSLTGLDLRVYVGVLDGVPDTES